MCYDEGISKEIVVKGQITSWNYLEYDSLLHVNSDVKELQNLLISLGYNVGEAGADGKFGKDTIAAVKQFQADYGVEKTGEVGLQPERLC